MAGRHCIFCGRKGVSNEHIIAKRFRKLFVVPGDGIPLLRGTGDAGVVGMWQGPIFDAQVKRVCRDHCNNGWMRAMDDQVEAPLSRMMTGQRCELTEEEQNAIAAWSVRIAMLYQYDNRWRIIWTDGRPLPTLADGGVEMDGQYREARWFGYSVGRWVDDYTLEVHTVGTMGEGRVWLDNTGRPVSDLARGANSSAHAPEMTSASTTISISSRRWR